jgi:crotonobetainyl-CoA:carnitine CoA-transferase CaiB-like acyl-CoA transferase
LTPEEALENEQITARGMVLQEDGLTQFAPPLKMSEFEFSIRQPAPAAGQHNAAILAAAGYSPDEIEQIAASGALG